VESLLHLLHFILRLTGPDILLWDDRTLSSCSAIAQVQRGPQNVNILGPQGAPFSRGPQNFMTPGY